MIDAYATRVVAEDSAPDVVSLDLETATALLDDGTTCPIVQLYDGDGNDLDVADHDELSPGEGAFMVGPTLNGERWLTGAFANYQKRCWH